MHAKMDTKGIEVKEGRDGSVGKKKGWMKEGLEEGRVGQRMDWKGRVGKRMGWIKEGLDKGRVRYKLGRVAKRKGWRREGLDQGRV